MHQETGVCGKEYAVSGCGGHKGVFTCGDWRDVREAVLAVVELDCWSWGMLCPGDDPVYAAPTRTT
jgi:hypothetical protein